MAKNSIALMVLGILTAAGFITYSYFSTISSNRASEGQEQNLELAVTEDSVVPTGASVGQAGTGVITGSIEDLLKRGTPLECTWQKTQDGFVINGTTYVDGARFSSISRISAPTGNVTAYAVGDSDMVHVWNSLTKTGQQFDREDLQALRPTGIETNDEAAGVLDEEYNFTCSNWNVDSALFAIPVDITFTPVEQ